MKSLERTRHGCNTCRERHAKCDETIPACRRCQKLGLECIRANPIRFTPLKGVPSGEPQRGFAKNTGEIIFIDESATVVDLYDTSSTRSISPIQEIDIWTIEEEQNPSPAAQDAVNDLSRDFILPEASQQSQSTPDFLDPSQVCKIPALLSRPYQWCLQNENEVQLLRHWVDVLSTWIDVCDGDRTFGVAIPRLIQSFPPLLAAILAVSAKHLGILNGRNLLSADRYNQECLSCLIPLLNNESAVTDEMILVVIVILRLSEEIEAPIVRADVPGHMLGIRQLVRAQGRLAQNSRLRYAALCVMVRQENYLALMNMCSIGWDLEDFTIPSNLDTADDFSWSMAVLRHCSSIIQLCQDNGSREKRELWDEMKTINENWLLCKPTSFNPVFSSAPDLTKGEPFPRQWFLQGSHATAMQHYHLNLVLLAISDPYIPQFGVGHMEAKRKGEDDILRHMRHVCGIAVANAQIQPCLVTAYMSISMCGDRFTDRNDQEKIVEILVQVNKQSGWPTFKVQQQLRKAWGWE